jgi:hypothetical protein
MAYHVKLLLATWAVGSRVTMVCGMGARLTPFWPASRTALESSTRSEDERMRTVLVNMTAVALVAGTLSMADKKS